MKSPTLHILIKIGQVRVVVVGLIKRCDLISGGKELNQRGLTCANVAGYSDDFLFAYKTQRTNKDKASGVWAEGVII